MAILLALIGVHGVLSYAVAHRAPELGIRMAFGASRWAVLRSVVGEGLAPAGAGGAACRPRGGYDGAATLHHPVLVRKLPFGWLASYNLEGTTDPHASAR